MIRHTSVLLAAGMLCAGASGAELAYAVRPTEVKAKPFTDAATVTKLQERSRVEVLNRQMSWIQVKSDANTGWVKMLSLRFDALTAAPTGGDDGLRTLFKVVGGGSSASTGGVRGFKTVDFTDPHPNPEALEAMNKLVVTPSEIEAFAAAGKLEAKPMQYIDAGGRK
jgi:hypothetical protein